MGERESEGIKKGRRGKGRMGEWGNKERVKGKTEPGTKASLLLLLLSPTLPFSLSPFLLFLIALALVNVACSSSSAADSQYFGKVEPPEGQVLRYYSGGEPQTLDPQKIVGQVDSRIAVALFDGLFEYDEKTVAPVPSLATNWEPNEDGTVWTFHLRRDARWSDGLPLNAHDFVYSWRRAVSPELAANYASMMYIVKNAQPYNEGAAFVRDPATGRFATEADVERSGKNGPINFTGPVPPSRRVDQKTSESLPAQEKYLFVPADAKDRASFLNGDPAKKKPGKPELTRFIEGKEIVPVTKEDVGVGALDDYTFEVSLENPTAYFIKVILNPFFRPVPRQAIEKWGNALWVKPEHIVTSGAFKLVEWTPYNRIVVVRNPLFWDNANTKLDKIIFPATEELTTAMNLYKAGEVDAVQNNTPPPAWRNQLKEKKDYVGGPYLGIEYVTIKTTMPPLNDVRVRRALSMAIKRQIIADQAPNRVPLTGFTPEMEGYVGAKGTDYNPDEARRLLAEAGFPGGKGFPELEIVYNTSESVKQTMEFVQSMLKRELGIKVTLTNQEYRVWLENTRNDKLNFKGLARRGWIGDYVDPNTFLELMLSGANNSGTGWKDPKYDAMLLAANAETDPAKRAEMLREAESYMLSQQPIIPLFITPVSIMVKPYVKNLSGNLLDQHNWRGVYIDHNWREHTGEQTASNAPFRDSR